MEAIIKEVEIMGMKFNVGENDNGFYIDTNEVGFGCDHTKSNIEEIIKEYVLAQFYAENIFDDSDKPYKINKIDRRSKEDYTNRNYDVYDIIVEYNGIWGWSGTSIINAIEGALCEIMDYEIEKLNVEELFQEQQRYVYTLTTGTYWFNIDNGALMARNLEEAREFAKNILREELEEICKILEKNGYELYYCLDDVEVVRSDL